MNSTIRKRIHRYVWEYYNGAIPKGYDVHHKDHDKSNNDISNLELITKAEHTKLHSKDTSYETKVERMNYARKFASKWHKSDVGREWHKELARKTNFGHLSYDKVCECCGKSYVAGSKRSRFCCGACKSKYARHHSLYNEIRKCIICGKEYSVCKYEKQQTCSQKCASILGHQKHKEIK